MSNGKPTPEERLDEMLRQGNISVNGAFYDWNTARVAYDLWLTFPAHVQSCHPRPVRRKSFGSAT